MTRKMSDSFDGVLAPGATMAMWYVDHPQSKPTEPGVKLISLARNFSEDADGGDCETGDLTPPQCPAWIQRQRARGKWAFIYCGMYNWANVRSAFATAGVEEPPYVVARYDNNPTIPDGAVAKQYANAILTGGDYDLSSVRDFWRGVDMATVFVVTGDGTVPDPIGPGAEYVTDGITKRWIDTVAESSALLALFGQGAIVKMDQAALNEIPLWNAIPPAPAPVPTPLQTVTIKGSGLTVTGPIPLSTVIGP